MLFIVKIVHYVKKQYLKIIVLFIHKEPEGNSIYELYKLFASAEEVGTMASNFRAGNYGYGHAKKELLAAYHRLFDPFREKREALEKDPGSLEDILRDGAARARAAAAPVMEKVRSAVGL